MEDQAGVALVRLLPDGVESRRHGDRMVELLVVHGGGS